MGGWTGVYTKLQIHLLHGHGRERAYERMCHSSRHAQTHSYKERVLQAMFLSPVPARAFCVSVGDKFRIV